MTLRIPISELSALELEAITSAIEGNLKNQRVLKTVVREVVVQDGEKRVEGYVEIPCAITRNNCLFDFEATLSLQSHVSYLMVNGSKILGCEK